MSESGSECIIETVSMIHKKCIKEGKVVCRNCLENKKMRKNRSNENKDRNDGICLLATDL